MTYGAKSIPDDIYVGFVKSLFKDAHILLIGAACHGTMALLVYRSSGNLIYLALAAALIAAGLYRYQTTRSARDGEAITDIRTAYDWERTYLLGATIQGLTAGLFSFTAIYLAPDSFGEVATVAVIIGSAVTIVGRNYGSRGMVLTLSLCVIVPICVAWMLKGDLNYFILGLFLVPFIFAMVQMARNVRTVLFTAITEEKKAKSLAQRFDRALNTMSHGLVMLNPDARVVVANSEAASMLGFSRPRQMMDRSLRALLMRGVAANVMSRKDARYAETQLTRALREGRDRKLLLRIAGNRYFEFSAREGRDELGVITFEEVTQRVEAEEKIRYMARFDNLTGLPNRAYFHEVVDEALAGSEPDGYCAIAIFDLDDFKSVNDTLGHPIGDGLITAVAERLGRHASERIRVSRFGGDEFMLFFREVSDAATLSAKIDEIIEGLAGDVDVSGHSLRIQASGGAVMMRVRDFDFDTVVVKADLALYAAKENGKNGWRLFEPAMDQAFRNKQLLKADLRQAVMNNGLRVVYQPIVSMDTMRIESCEALCRWDHPELGPIAPSIFIPLAEEMGIISDISTFIIRAATQECARWPNPISVSINLSAKDFRNADVVGKIASALKQTRLAPSRLEVEVTETALLDDRAQTRTYIEQIKALGVRIALDDFGTGYSSLSYLHTLPLDKVKIDRSFIVDVTRNQRSLELMKGVVDLSKRLGLTVTVEGVETFEQLKVLALEVKPELVQGFLFGSALTASGIDTMSSATWPFASQIKANARS